MSLRKIVEVAVLLSALVSFSFLFFGYDFLYEKVIYRGYLETEMWLNRVENGEYAAPYYHVVYYLISQFGLSLPFVVNTFSILTIVAVFKYFDVFKSYRGGIYCLIVLNVFTILLLFSPGRTSLTVFLVFYVLCFSIPKIRLVPFLFLSIILAILHLETLLVVYMFLAFRWFIFIVRFKVDNFFIKALLYLTCYSSLVAGMYLLLLANTSYANVVDASGDIFNILFIFFTVASVWFFCDKNYFVLLSFISIFLLFLLGLNGSYSYRVVILPILFGVYMEVYSLIKVNKNGC